jgi:hypothetical protein
MIVRLDQTKSRWKSDFNESVLPIIVESDSLSCGDVFKKGDDTFVIVSSKGTDAIAEQIHIDQEPNNTDYEKNITCPVCGYEDQDSWEHGDDSSESYDCGRCGAVLSYQREITIEYSISVVKMPEIKIIG